MIDFNKPVQTRDGRKARVLCTDGADVGRPIVGFVEGFMQPMTWPMHGIYSSSLGESLNDLINVPERVDKWFNLYPDEAGMAFDSRAESVEASGCSLPRMLALIKVTFEDGKPVAVALEDCK